MTLTDADEIEFLKQSNYIEGEDGNIEQPARAWQFIKSLEEMSNSDICKAHKILMLDKPYPPPRGYFRSVPQINVTVGGHTAPNWWLVDGLMSNWCLDYEAMGWQLAHIRFESIHPFVDGNGRMGRILMNWQRLKEGLPILIIHEGKEQQDYYKWFHGDFRNI
jgi:Fic family protein